jgi:threonine/homoserine/homoserine lactone efflux protein
VAALLLILLKGMLIGFSIAAPVGPIGLLCIGRTLARGHRHGLVSGLGAATADAFYGSVAGFGLTFISGFLVDHQVWLRLIGGLFLCYLGLRTLLSRSAGPTATESHRGLLYDYVSTLCLTLTNPVTILAFAAIFAGLGVTADYGDYGAAGALVAGVFLGSALWWLGLSGAVSVLRARLNPVLLTWVNRLSGLVIVGFGLAALASLALPRPMG